MFNNKYTRIVLLLLATALVSWTTVRIERTFNQAWTDYQDFKAMRVFLIQLQQRAAQPLPSPPK